MWHPLKDDLEAMMEKTGLTDLILVCENNAEIEATVNNRIGHKYKSNDADCSTVSENYIKGIKMQREGIFPEYEPTMIHNLAIACTQDFDKRVIKERILRYIPEIPKGEMKDIDILKLNGYYPLGKP